MNKYDLLIVDWNEKEFLVSIKTLTIGWLYKENETIFTILSSITENGSFLTIEIPRKCISKIIVIQEAKNCPVQEKINAWTQNN